VPVAVRLSWMVVALAALASVLPIAWPAIYRDNALVASGWFGNDLVTLAVAVPLLAGALLRAPGSDRARLVWFGLLAYMVYNYAFYLFGAAFNSLFLLYAGLFTLSAFALALALADTDVPILGRSVRYTTSVFGVALYMLLVALLLGGFWVSTSLEYVFTGRVPPVIEAVGHPTNVIAALDLSMVVSVALLAGHLLWRRRPWGFVLGVIWNVKGAAYMTALSAAAFAEFRSGAAENATQIALWAPIGVGCAVSALVLLRALADGPRPSA
jgi:hypothetical protein